MKNKKISDTAFKSCFISKNFNYDLTQKFRKNNLFQNKTFIGFYDSQCNYGGYNEETGYAKMICKSLNITGHEFENFNLTDKNKEDNLVMECTKDAKNLQENIIVLIYLIVFIIFVTFDILSFILCMKKLPNNNALKNDGLEIEPLSMKSTEGIDSNEIKINENGLWKIFIKNFKMIHPLFGIFSPSIIQPQLFKVSILFFNLFMLFGLNAFYFNIFGESLIEKRIFNKHRNNIIYPLKYELLKIVYSIITSMILTFIIRLINFTNYEKKNKLKQLLKRNLKEKDVIERYSNEMFKRRLIAGLIMLILSIFMTFYACVFCLIYINSQIGWLYSGIWTLLINWILLSNVYIFIITVIEILGFEKISYMLEKLCVF